MLTLNRAFVVYHSNRIPSALISILFATANTCTCSPLELSKLHLHLCRRLQPISNLFLFAILIIRFLGCEKNNNHLISQSNKSIQSQTQRRRQNQEKLRQLHDKANTDKDKDLHLDCQQLATNPFFAGLCLCRLIVSRAAAITSFQSVSTATELLFARMTKNRLTEIQNFY